MPCELVINHHFDAAHRLQDYEGDCQNLHGHTWRVEVWVQGPIRLDSGMVADFRDVKSVINMFDHRTILESTDPLVEVLTKASIKLCTLEDPPTAEVIAEYLLAQIPLATKVRVWESEDCSATCWRYDE